MTLVETEAVGSPALFGFVRPRLLLPAGLMSQFTREELRHVFMHELAHVKRRDILFGWLTLACRSSTGSIRWSGWLFTACARIGNWRATRWRCPLPGRARRNLTA